MQVLRNNLGGAHLILVTRGSSSSLSISDEQTIEEYVRYYHIRVSSVLVPSDANGSGGGGAPLAFFDTVAKSSGGRSHVVRGAAHRRSMEVYLGLVDAFAGLAAGSGAARATAPRVVHENVIEVREQLVFKKKEESFVFFECLIVHGMRSRWHSASNMDCGQMPWIFGQKFGMDLEPAYVHNTTRHFFI